MIRRLAGIAAWMSFAVCLAAPVLYFAGKTNEGGYKLIFSLASVGWFILATMWMTMKKKS